MYYSTVGDSWVPPTLSATDDVDGSVDVEIIDDDNYDLNTIGSYTIRYRAVDSSDNEAFLSITLIVQVAGGSPGEYTGYYASLSGLSGNSLISSLYTLLNNTGTYSTTTYGQANTYLCESDRSLTDSSKVWLIYNSALVSRAWDSGSTWNKEHVWAKSLFGTGSYDPGSSTRGIEADLHNLRAANPSVNSSRGNKLFASQVNNSTYGSLGSTWYPGNDHRGDVARIIFYMDIRWGNDTNISNIGNLATLKQWHELDPVDQFEINRNNVIYNYQHNRNPFIDHPELVNLIYS